MSQTNPTAPGDFFMVFLNGVSASSTYVFNITYRNEGLTNALNEANTAWTNGGGDDKILPYANDTMTFFSRFTISADIFAAVNFQHALTDTQSITGTLPDKMKEDEEHKAMLNTRERNYTLSADGTEFTAAWGDPAISKVTLPNSRFTHPSAEFIGWTTDPAVGGVVWASAVPDSPNFYPKDGSEQLEVTQDQLDSNNEITVYSVFRLKINKKDPKGDGEWKWTYGDNPYTGDPDQQYFSLPVNDQIAAGSLTMIRIDSSGKAEIVKPVVTFNEGMFRDEFNKAYSPSTNAGKYLVLAGNIDSLPNTDATNYDAWRDNLVTSIGSGNTYVVSEFEVTPAELGTGSETGTAANNSKIVDSADLTNQNLIYNRERLVDGISLQFNADETLSLASDTDYTTKLLYWDDSQSGKETADWSNATSYTDSTTAQVLEHVEDRGKYRLVLTGKAQTVSGSSGYGYTDGNYRGTYIIDFTVNPAKISLNDMSKTELTYNREAQWLDVQGAVLKNERTVGPITYTVPQLNNGTAPEFGVWYEAENGVNMQSGFDGDTETKSLLPYYADKYKVTVILLGNGQRNFTMTDGHDKPFSTEALTYEGTPNLVTSEPTRSGNGYNDYKWECKSQPLSENVAAGLYAKTSFTITAREISVTQRNKTHVYDAYEHIEDAAQFEFYSSGMTFDGVTYNVNLYSTQEGDNVSERQGGTRVATVHILGLNDFQPDDAKFENTTPGGTDTSTYWKIGTDNMNAYYVTLGSSDTHYSYADLDKLDSAKNGGDSYVQNKGTYYAEIELQTGNFKFASSSDFTPVEDQVNGHVIVRATYTITAAVIGIAYSFYSQTYDPKRRFYFEVTLTDNTNGRTYKIGFTKKNESEDGYTLDALAYTTEIAEQSALGETKNSFHGLKAENFLSTLSVYTRTSSVWTTKQEDDFMTPTEIIFNDILQKGVSGLPGQKVDEIGNYWLYAVLKDTDNYQLSVSANVQSLGNGKAYAESFYINPDNSHTVNFVAGIGTTEAGNITDFSYLASTLPVTYSYMSFGSQVTLPKDRRISVTFKDGSVNRYLLVGWTRKAPTADTTFADGWLFNTKDDLSGQQDALQSYLLAIFKSGNAEQDILGGAGKQFYTISDSDTETTFDLYAIWVLDNDESEKPDWEEHFKLEYKTGATGFTGEGDGWPTNVDSVMAGTSVTLQTGGYWLTKQDGDVTQRYILYGWTEISYDDALRSVSSTDMSRFTDEFENGYILKNADDMALLYGYITNRQTSYTVRSQDAKDGTITLYAIWAPDNNNDSHPELDATQYTVLYNDTTSGKAIMPEAKTGPHGTHVATLQPVTGESKNDRSYLTDNADKYIFYGWTLYNSGEMAYVCHEEGELKGILDGTSALKSASNKIYYELDPNAPTTPKNVNYQINAIDAKDGTINLYAVWVLDNNENGKPDWEETSAQLTYQNDVEGTVAFIEGYSYTLQNFQGREDEKFDATFTADGLNVKEGVATSGKIVDHVLPGKGFALPGLGSANEYAIKRTGTDGNVYLLIGWTTAGGMVEGFSYVFQYTNGTQTPDEVYTKNGYHYYAVGASYTMPSEEGETLHAVWAIDGNNNGKPDYQETYQVTFQRDEVAAGAGCTVTPSWTDITYNNQNLGTELQSQTSSYTLTKGKDQYILVGFTTQKGEENVYFVDTQPTKDGDYTYVDRNEAYIVAAKDDIADGTKDNAIVFYAVWGLDANKDGKPDWSNDKYTVSFSLDPHTRDDTVHHVNTEDQKLPDIVYKAYENGVYSDQYDKNQVEIGDKFYWNNSQYTVKHGDAGVPCMYVGEADSADRKHYILLGWTTNHALTNYLFESSAPQFTLTRATAIRLLSKI